MIAAPAAGTLRAARPHHPEAGAAALAALAWVALLVPLIGPAAIRQLHADAHRDHPLLAGAAGWLIMSVAMMVPSALPTVREHARGALWARRRRTVALFLGGHLLTWAAFGVAAAAVVALATEALGADRRLVVAAALVLAAAYQAVPLKWRAVRECHRRAPLPPRGPAADRACLRAGTRYGGWCVASCWPPMLAMAAAGHAALGLMLVLTALMAAERQAPRAARYAGAVAAVLTSEALIALAVG